MSEKNCFFLCERRFEGPQVMGILNATPDSFYAQSRMQTEEEIARRANQIMEEGGSMIDVGACSTRPGGDQPTLNEEMTRMRRALDVIRKEMPDAFLSIDTYRPEVARMAVEEYGASLINDTSGGSEEMFLEVSRLGVAYLLMSSEPDMESTISMMTDRIFKLRSLGCKEIVIDPGYGFGKDIHQNYRMLRHQQKLKDKFHLPLLVGVSRKRMIWQLLGTEPAEALDGTIAVNALALERGADILRVHDVKEAKNAITINAELWK